jgi:hypothetical protein
MAARLAWYVARSGSGSEPGLSGKAEREAIMMIEREREDGMGAD